MGRRKRKKRRKEKGKNKNFLKRGLLMDQKEKPGASSQKHSSSIGFKGEEQSKSSKSSTPAMQCLRKYYDKTEPKVGASRSNGFGKNFHQSHHTGYKTTYTTYEPATPRPDPVLKFSPYAWAKLVYIRDKGNTEIGGFGIAAEEDPLRIIDFATVKQKTGCASVEFDDEAVANFFDDQVDAGRKPRQFARVWLHTHPGNSASPSVTDEATFERVFGKCDWAVMFILGQGGEHYARLRFNVGPKGEIDIPTRMTYALPFEGSNEEAWEAEYTANIERETYTAIYTGNQRKSYWEDEENRQPWRKRDPSWWKKGKTTGQYGPGFRGHFEPLGSSDDVLDDNDTDEYDYYHGLREESGFVEEIRGFKDDVRESVGGEEDDVPDVVWPLREELTDMTVEEKAYYMGELDLTEQEVDDYDCHWNSEGFLVVTLKDEIDESTTLRITDEAEVVSYK